MLDNGRPFFVVHRQFVLPVCNRDGLMSRYLLRVDSKTVFGTAASSAAAGDLLVEATR